MYSEAIIAKFGYKEGLSFSGDEITGWPYAAQKPSSEELKALASAYAKVQEERAWRDSELPRADIEINKVQDGMGAGLVSEWRAYRCLLRDYPAQPDFPNGVRPVAPDNGG
jgi:hypothetical protein